MAWLFGRKDQLQWTEHTITELLQNDVPVVFIIGKIEVYSQ